MGAMDAVIKWFAGGAAPAAGKVADPIREAVGKTIDPDDHLYRSITDPAQRRDLTPVEQDRMQRIAAYLWESNPLANRLVTLPTAYLVGEGVRLQVTNEDAQKVLRRFWQDPINALDIKLEAMIREDELFGEQCYPVFVNTVDGHVRLGYLDPAAIDRVVMDPENSSQPIGVVTKKDAGGKQKSYSVIVGGDDEEIFGAAARQTRATFTDGQCFYKRSNYLLGGRRGRSAFLAQFDWLDSYDEFLFEELDRTRDLRTVMWDVTLIGATPADIDEKARKISAPTPRSVRVHNEQETWEAKVPKLEAADTEANARLFRNHILGGGTVPEHWFGGGGDVNRAVGAEMGEPTFKVLTQKQRAWKHFLELIARFVLEQAAQRQGLAGYDPEDDDYQVEAVFPELTAKDTTKYAAALQQVVAACVMQIDKGLLTEATAVKIIASVAGRMGVDYDAEAELKAAQEEHQARQAEMAKRAEDQYGNPPNPADADPEDPEQDPAAAAASASARAPAPGAAAET
jgi:hypothetical protein